MRKKNNTSESVTITSVNYTVLRKFAVYENKKG